MSPPSASSTDSPVAYEVADRVATITVSRPDKLNALNDATLGALADAIDRARESGDVGGVILPGAGRAWVAGAEISRCPRMPVNGACAFAVRGRGVLSRFDT